MKKENFINLINAITGKEFSLKNNDGEIEESSNYDLYAKNVYSDEIRFAFTFKTGKNNETLIKTFITQYCNKYKEPNPKSYDGRYGSNWDDMTNEQKAFAYCHHSSHMFSKDKLALQIKANIEDSNITDAYCKYGFYPTLYGIGIFIIYATESEMKAVIRLKEYLDKIGVPYSNEFSNARWVYRFIIKINKDVHLKLINDFNN